MSQSVKFEQIVKVVNEFSSIGENRGLGKLYTGDEALNGRNIHVKGKSLIHFGSCGYLGLELDRRLKEAAIEAVEKYGSYFSCSRIFVSTGNYLELEELLADMFGHYILLTQNTSLGHNAVMPIIIGGNDIVIYDQQAHFSMQDLSYKLSCNGTGIDVLRHNRLDELEKKIEAYKSKYDKIWYVVDGVYSMFGDLSPVKDIIKLLDKHKKFYLYLDDAHGMSWAGPKGTGYAFGQTELHQKMILGTSMAKGFGSCGGIFVFPNLELREKVRHWGGPLSHSGPQEPATIAAAIASAKIHLTDEIYELQRRLQNRIRYCSEIMSHYKVPLVSESASPIFFIACGLPRVGFNLVERLMNEGFYTNIGIFPAVPETCTGVRFTITNHLSYYDIEKLAKAVAKHLPEALKSEERGMQDIYKAFRKFTDFEARLGTLLTVNPNGLDIVKKENQLTLKRFDSVTMIDKSLWDNHLGDRGAFNWDNLVLLEKTFAKDQEPENTWKFFYYLVKDSNGKVILATFFTLVLVKDDMIAAEKISEKIEIIRQDQKYYLTSLSLMMGSQLTNGNHLYLARENPQWKKAMELMINDVWQLQETNNANTLFFRDFQTHDNEFEMFLIEQGFVKIENLENNYISGLRGFTFEEFYTTRLNSKKRNQIKTEVLPDIDKYTFKVNNYEDFDIDLIYRFYLNVKSKNLILNTFNLPIDLFHNIANSEHWEIVTLVSNENKSVVAMSLCLKSVNSYCHMVFGIDENVDISDGVYKKMLYFIIRRAFELNVDNFYMGITANDTKRKFGAVQETQVAFIQQKDHYNQDLIDSMAFGD
jgi:7-keto-8-aminopelargonate synthetase-like enzyme/predicted N-acyltransferase